LRIAEVPISAALSLPLPREKAAAIAESKFGEPARGYTRIFDAVADAADAFCLRTSVPALEVIAPRTASVWRNVQSISRRFAKI